MIEIAIGQCLLKKLLDSRGMTQQELSIITGINETQLSGYISMTRQSMNLKTAKKIALALNCRIDDLYDWKVINHK
ncbi:helix-turn-helix domain-containing protein [Metabacillus fastidiosus]|uniref:helix-turn-helix domain-containing protein n=1 Tax=Metabacillus fastidiosus TaxID=1458 RepID=UPI003D292EFF